MEIASSGNREMYKLIRLKTGSINTLRHDKKITCQFIHLIVSLVKSNLIKTHLG